MNLKLIFLVVAIICFILRAIGISARIDLGWVGMAFFAGAFIV